MAGWSYADIWERVAERIPQEQALVHGDVRRTWAEFDRRADGLAATFLAAGVDRQDKVAIYLYNGPEYLEAMFGAFKVSLVPVNTNHRYSDDELVNLWDNSDSVAVVFHGVFTETVERIREKVGARLWLWVDDGTGDCPDWAMPFEEAASSAEARVAAPRGRDGEERNVK
jgi:fatty-acyl-CoA synthase